MGSVLQTRIERIANVRAAGAIRFPDRLVTRSMKKHVESPTPACTVLQVTAEAPDSATRSAAQQFEADSSASPTEKEVKCAPNPWQTGSGEGAASALESLRTLERHRGQGQPRDDRRSAGH